MPVGGEDERVRAHPPPSSSDRGCDRRRRSALVAGELEWPHGSVEHEADFGRVGRLSLGRAERNAECAFECSRSRLDARSKHAARLDGRRAGTLKTGDEKEKQKENAARRAHAAKSVGDFHVLLGSLSNGRTRTNAPCSPMNLLAKSPKPGSGSVGLRTRRVGREPRRSRPSVHPHGCAATVQVPWHMGCWTRGTT